MTVYPSNITFYAVNYKDIGIHNLEIKLDDKYSKPNIYRMKVSLNNPEKGLNAGGLNDSANSSEVIKTDFRIIKITKDG